MLGSVILEVSMALTFLYSLLALLCSAAAEGLESFSKRRSHNLAKALRLMLGEDGAELLWQHELLNSLRRESTLPGSPKVYPSYLSSRVFALALLDIAENAKEVGKTLAEAPAPFGPILRSLGRTAGSDVQKLSLAVESWFDDTMERTSGWYKRHAQRVIFIVAFSAAAVLNLDSVMLGRVLYHNGALREKVLAQAESYVKAREARGVESPTPAPANAATATPATPSPSATRQTDPSARAEVTLHELASLDLPIGWDATPNAVNGAPHNALAVVMKVLGLLATALAASLGAPFWFDILNRLVTLRGSVKPPPKQDGNEAPAPSS